MALKNSKEIMHSLLMNRHKLSDINDHILDQLNSEVSSSKALVKARRSISSTIGYTERYDDAIDDHKMLLLFSVNPICTYYATLEEADSFDMADSIKINPIISSKGLKASSHDFTNFSLSDLLKWTNFLNSKKITSNISYMVALHNLCEIASDDYYFPIANPFDDDFAFDDGDGFTFNLCDKDEKLSNLNQDLTFNLSKAHHANSTNKGKYLSKALKLNESIRVVSDSNQNIYIDDYSEYMIHKILDRNIFKIQKFILHSKTSNSKAIICPHCHTYTYGCFNYCQNCGAKIK